MSPWNPAWQAALPVHNRHPLVDCRSMPVSQAKSARIRSTVAAIPPGCVCAYGRIAELAGLPGRARLVGQVLSELPPGHDLPWHRVVRASGAVAFPAGSDPFSRQVSRLREEGVAVKDGKVDLERHGWQMSLAQRLWGVRDAGG